MPSEAILNDRISAPTTDDDQVLLFSEWIALNRISRATAYRLIAKGEGPHFIRLSAKRRGVTVGENRQWQKSRRIETAA